MPAPSTLRLAAVIAASLALTATGLYFRPLLPVDETRYLSVAWEMFAGGDWLVPHLNGEPYSHKPPLLFWLINLGWSLFGVSELWGRLVGPLAGIGCLLLLARLAKLLWPDREGDEITWLAPLIVASSVWWMLASTLTYFDTLLALWVLLGVIGLMHAAAQTSARRTVWGFLLFGLGLGLGALTKGPVVLVHLLPVALAAPLWIERPVAWGRWYGGVLASVALGAAMTLAWAIPAGQAGGEAYAQELFWEQTAGRMAGTFPHRQQFWWYLPMALLALLPWSLWPPFWRGAFVVARKAWQGADRSLEPALKLCLIWALAGFLILSVFSGKQMNYLLPLFAPVGLAMARAIARNRHRQASRDHWPAMGFAAAVGLLLLGVAAALKVEPGLSLPFEPPIRAPMPYFLAGLILLAAAGAAARIRRRGIVAAVAALALLPAGAFAAFHVAVVQSAYSGFDISPTAHFLAEQMRAGRPIAVVDDYHGEYHFLGRLPAPVEVMTWRQAAVWIHCHPDGLVVTRSSEQPPSRSAPVYQRPMRARMLSVWDKTAFPAMRPREEP